MRYPRGMDRHEFRLEGLRLSYLDRGGGDGGGGDRVLIALHALIMEAATFAPTQFTRGFKEILDNASVHIVFNQ